MAVHKLPPPPPFTDKFFGKIVKGLRKNGNF